VSLSAQYQQQVGGLNAPTRHQQAMMQAPTVSLSDDFKRINAMLRIVTTEAATQPHQMAAMGMSLPETIKYMASEAGQELRTGEFASPLEAGKGALAKFGGEFESNLQRVPGGEWASDMLAGATEYADSVDLGKIKQLIAAVVAPGFPASRTAKVGKYFRETGLEGIPGYGVQKQIKDTPRMNSGDALKQAAADQQLIDRLPQARENIERGIASGDALPWYNMEPVYEGVVEELGEEGAERWLRGFAARMGPTSSGQKVPQNVGAAMWAQHAAQAGADIRLLDPSNVKPWSPKGHQRYYNAMLPGLGRIQDLEEAGMDAFGALDVRGAFKTRRYTEGVGGNYQNPPPDMHMTLQGYGHRNPSVYEQRAIENIHQDLLAPEYGLEPIQTQAAQWVGGAGQTGIADTRALVPIFNEQLAKGAQSMGLSEAEFFRRMVHGELPVGALRMPRLPTGKGYRINTVTPEDFVSARDVFAAQSRYGSFLSDLTPSQILDSQSISFLDDTGTVGYTIGRDGTLNNLFNNSGRPGAGRRAVEHAIQQGAVKLDAFDGFLPKLYRKHGFVETGRMGFADEFAPPGWNYAVDKRPDVVEMALDPARRRKTHAVETVNVQVPVKEAIKADAKQAKMLGESRKARGRKPGKQKRLTAKGGPK
jgi:hypothetical protein